MKSKEKETFKVGDKVIVNFLGTLYPAIISESYTNPHSPPPHRICFRATGLNNIKFTYIGINGSEKWSNINDADQVHLTKLFGKYDSNTGKSKKRSKSTTV